MEDVDFFSSETGSHYSPGCPQFKTGPYVFQADLKFKDCKLILLPLRPQLWSQV